MRTSKLLAILLLALALVASACAGGDDDGGDDATEGADAGAEDGGDDAAGETDLLAAAGCEPGGGGGATEDGATEGADAGDQVAARQKPATQVAQVEVAQDDSVSGDVSILHAFTGEADVNGLQAIIDDFEEQYPNVSVSQEGSNDFESLARTRVGAGTPPDIILHPQPGLLEEFANAGDALPLDFLDVESFRDDLVAGQLDVVTFDDQLYAVPVRLSLKSLVWYNQPVFEAEGYEEPQTWCEMLELTQTIAEETDYAPWCIGVESGDATGWTATDWIEDILLRELGPEQYDAWVTGELDFASEEVQGAIESYMAPIWTNDEYVNGGRENIVREAFGTSVNGILGGEDGECVLHRQATFIEGFISEADPDAEFGTDYSFFFLPPIDEEIGTPALGAGDLAAIYTENEAAQAFIEFLTTAESGEGWAELGGFLSPFSTFDASAYPTDSSRRAGELLADADFFRFDGSDLMPGDVGSSSEQGSFWTEMVEWISGDQELGESLEQIDELYAESTE